MVLLLFLLENHQSLTQSSIADKAPLQLKVQSLSRLLEEHRLNRLLNKKSFPLIPIPFLPSGVLSMRFV